MSKNRVVIRNVPAPTLEIDPSARALYIRFSKARVHKTLAEEEGRPGVVLTRDLDARNNLVGIEVIGVRQFSIKLIRQLLPRDLKGIDLESARFVPASSCPSEPIES